MSTILTDDQAKRFVAMMKNVKPDPAIKNSAIRGRKTIAKMAAQKAWN